MKKRDFIKNFGALLTAPIIRPFKTNDKLDELITPEEISLDPLNKLVGFRGGTSKGALYCHLHSINGKHIISAPIPRDAEHWHVESDMHYTLIYNKKAVTFPEQDKQNAFDKFYVADEDGNQIFEGDINNGNIFYCHEGVIPEFPAKDLMISLDF